MIHQSLYDLTTRSLKSPTQSISTISSDSNSSLKKSKFDDRSITKTSLALKQYQNTPKSENFNEDKTPFNNIFKWSELKTISETISSREFINSYGEIQLVQCSQVYIAFTTSKSTIVIFNYRQEIDFVLNCEVNATCLSFSLDSSILISGLANGSIQLWNIKESSPVQILPYFTIDAISIDERFKQKSDGHLSHCKIVFVSFIGQSIDKLISIDESGLVFFHHGTRKFMKNYFITNKLLGDYDLLDEQSKILDCQLLPLGSDYQVTDDMGVAALMTNNALTIISMVSLNDPSVPHVKQHFSIRSKQMSNSPVLSWFPCIKSKKIENARLAFCWNNILHVLEVDTDVYSTETKVNDVKDKDRALGKLPIMKTSREVLDEPIRFVKWLQSNILLIFLKRKMMTYFYENKQLCLVGYDSVEADYAKILKQTSLIKNKSTLYLGKSLNWADILLDKLASGDYLNALSLANSYYNSSNTSKLSVIGLPSQQKKRANLIQPILIKIMKESLSHLMKSDQQLCLRLYLNIISYVANNDILEELYEAVLGDEMFFNALEPFILNGSIDSLPPVVLKKLVDYYILRQEGDILTEIICTLDIKLLDIDLTIQLCKKHNLRDCMIYIWTFLLNDYATPLKDFIKDFNDPEFLKSADHLKAYSYISHVLTRRQYPTDNYIENSAFARNSICSILFSNNAIKDLEAIDEDVSIYPYLSLFLKVNSFEMLSALNEFFEDSCLNEDPNLNRQYIIDVLLDVYKFHDFSNTDKRRLAIFIGRNYSKYSQFIRLSQSTILEIVNQLCENDDPNLFEDSELALQSLLPNHDFEDDEFIIEKLKMGKYFNVLINIYKSEGNYSEALKTYFSSPDEKSLGIMTSLIEDSLNHSTNLDRTQIIQTVRDNFSIGLKLDIPGFFNLVDRLNPDIHEEILKFDEEEVIFEYLSEYFKKYDSRFFIEYVTLLIKFKKDEVFDFTERHIEDLPYDEIMSVFENNNIVEARALLLMKENKYIEAADLLIEELNQLLDQKDHFIFILNILFTICKEPKTSCASDNMSMDETLWLKVLSTLVELSNSSKDSTFLNECIHDCFKQINNSTSQESENLFFIIFNKFLESYKDKTVLSNIKQILHSVFISYSFDTEILALLMNVLNSDIHNKMEFIQGRALQGWNILNKNCGFCGKPIFGSKLSTDCLDEHYLAWQDHECSKILLQSNNTRQYDNLKLIFFKCNHNYHLSCLSKMNNKNVCIICES